MSADRAVRRLFQQERLLGCARVLKCGVLALAAMLTAPLASAEGRSDDTVKVIAESGFLDDIEGVKPARGASYEMAAPRISLPSPKNAIVIIYMHGTQNPRSRSSCGAWWNDAPATLKVLAVQRPDQSTRSICSAIKCL